MILKPCPFCKKDIPRSITACPYCRRDEQGKPVVMDTAQVEISVHERQFQADIKELASEDPFTRDQAVMRMSQRGGALVPALLAVLQDFSKPGLAGVARVLGKIADPRSVPVLAQAAKMGDEELRMVAVSALAQIHTPEALTPLLAEAEKPHQIIQSYIASILATFQDRRVVPVLSRLATHQNREIAFQAACALGELGGPDALSALQEAWHKGDLLVRSASAASLRRLGSRPSRISKRGWVLFAVVFLSVLAAVGWYFYR